MSESESESQFQWGWQPAEPVNLGLTLVYLCIFLVGVLGNLWNCLVIADSHNRYMKTATNYYLFSLSVSDLLLLVFGLPHDLVNLWHPTPYMFGQFVCLTRGWISEASTYASVLVIVAFSVERYLAICHPLRAHTLSRLSRSVKIIVLIWLVASSCALLVVREYGLVESAAPQPQPQPQQQQVRAPAEAAAALCTTVSRNATIFELSVLTFFIVPMAVITILYVKLGCHLRHKTQAIKRHRRQNQHQHQHREQTASQQTYYTCATSSGASPVHSKPAPEPARAGAAWPACLACCGAQPAPPTTAATTTCLTVEGPSDSLDEPGGPAPEQARGLLQRPAPGPLAGSPTSLSLGPSGRPAARRKAKPRRARAGSCGQQQQHNQKPSVSSTSTLTSCSSELAAQSLDGARPASQARRAGQETTGSRAPPQQKYPFALQSTVNTASMQSVIKMLVSVVVMFFICWAPFHAQRLMAIYVDQPTKEQELIYSCLNHISGISYYISALVNPILYSLFSLKFRQASRDTFGRLCGRRR